MENQARFEGYGFEKLEIWKLSLQIVSEIYLLIKQFLQSELYALSDQLKRAGTSIALNIAEGTGQSTKKSFSLYLERAKASGLECVACIKIALQQGFIKPEGVTRLERLLESEYFKIIAFNKSLKL